MRRLGVKQGNMRKIFNEPACLVGDSLVVADLHLGLERELLSMGLRVPSQRAGTEGRLLRLVEKTGARRVVILGDLKHSIPGASRQEYAEVTGLVGSLQERVEVVLVKGNHDSRIEELVPSLRVVDSLVVGDVLLIHGHRRPPHLNFSRIVMGHNHPAVEFVDNVGGVMREKVWLELELRDEALSRHGLERSPRVTVMPAFSELIEGVGFNREMSGQGPLLRGEMVRMEEARAYLLDGTELGRLRELAELLPSPPPGRTAGR
ncbi:MAG: metallophosphoesterase [Euryarchaeota archaeon]|nr:metallophosphoesterase [Euryarchaeota archaeon]